jgi:hypothetical protein
MGKCLLWCVSLRPHHVCALPACLWVVCSSVPREWLANPDEIPRQCACGSHACVRADAISRHLHSHTVSHTPLLQDNIHQCGMVGGSCVACVACGGSSAWMDILCNMDAAHNPPDSV